MLFDIEIQEMRLYATNFVHSLILAGTKELHHWIPQLIIPQLFDPSPAVSTSALACIQLGITDLSFLNAIIACRPDPQHLCLNDSSILIGFLRSTEGFEYLKEIEFLDGEYQYWIEVHK